jgi:[NiFe] hydrogenase assembly HybE family chaperone
LRKIKNLAEYLAKIGAALAPDAPAFERGGSSGRIPILRTEGGFVKAGFPIAPEIVRGGCASPSPDLAVGEASPEAMNAAPIGEAIEARYRHIAATAMAGLPICNAALAVAAEGFRVHAGRAVGIVVTPWFMNFVAADLADAPLPPGLRAGSLIKLALPAGDVELIVGELPGFGRLDSCSLFSPMGEFADMASAVLTARKAMRALFAARTSRPAAAPRALDRRAFLRGRLNARAEGAR